MEYVVRNAKKTEHFTAGDTCSIAEIMHPKNDTLPFDSLSLAHAEIAPHGKTTPHKLTGSSEIYYIISGTGSLFIQGTKIQLTPGTAAAVPPACDQYVINEGAEPLEFLCIVTPQWKKEEEIIL